MPKPPDRKVRTLPQRERNWLEEIRKACDLPAQEAPHIGPPLLTRLLDGLLAQDRAIGELETDLDEAVHCLKAVLQGDDAQARKQARVFVGLMERR